MSTDEKLPKEVEKAINVVFLENEFKEYYQKLLKDGIDRDTILPRMLWAWLENKINKTN